MPISTLTNSCDCRGSFLLYRYRQEYGESTLCNFRRFHKRYQKSTNRIEDKRGGKLEEIHRDNPAGGPSIAPLPVAGSHGGVHRC